MPAMRKEFLLQFVLGSPNLVPDSIDYKEDRH